MAHSRISLARIANEVDGSLFLRSFGGSIGPLRSQFCTFTGQEGQPVPQADDGRDL